MEEERNIKDELQELENIESTALLIEDLNNGDESVAINALSKLTSIANLIGGKCTREEIIPLITKTIPKIKHNSELMLVLAEQLGLLLDCIGSEKYIPLLLPPLELIANNDEATVREKAIESMSKIAAKLDHNQHINELLPMVMKLCNEETYKMRITAVELIPLVYSHVNTENQALLHSIYTELLKDEIPMVRKAAIKSYGKILTTDIDPDFITTLKILIQDTQEIVRISTIEVVAKIITMHKPELNKLFLPLIKQAAEENKTWRLRFTVAKITPMIIGSLPISEVEEFPLNWIMILLVDGEPEVRTQAILALPKLVKHCSIPLFVERVFPLLKKNRDSSEHVRAALAGVVCELAESVEEKSVGEFIVPICIELSKDSNTDVKFSLFKKIYHVIQVLSNSQVETYILPLLSSVATEKQWRLRLELVNHLSEFAKTIDSSIFKEKLGPLVLDMLSDPVYEIRMQAGDCLIKLGDIFGSTWIEEQVLSKLNEFKGSADYLIRVSLLMLIKKLKNSVRTEFVVSKALSIVLSLKDDGTANVRLNVAKCVEGLASKLYEEVIKNEVLPALKRLADDLDFDVRYFAIKALQSIGNY